MAEIRLEILRPGRFCMRPTALQVGLLAESELTGSPGINIVQKVGSIDEPLVREAFASSWSRVVSEFDVLRMGLHRSNRGRVEARFAQDAKFCSAFFDLTHEPLDDAEASFEHEVRRRRAAGIDVASPPAMTVACFEFGRAHWRFVWTYHHSMLDGYSAFLVLKRFFECYDAFRNGVAPPDLSPPEFRSFLEWSSQQEHVEGLTFYRRLLKNFEIATPLPFSRRNREFTELRPALVSRPLDRDQTARILTFAEQLEVTANTVVQMVWGLVLSRYSGQSDVVFGATWSLRGAGCGASEDMAGLLMNTTPVRLRVNRGQTVREAVRQLRTQHVQSRPFREAPLNLIMADNGFRPDSPLFRSIVVFDYQRWSEHLKSADRDWNRRSVESLQSSGNPLTVEVYFVGERLMVEIESGAGVVNERQAVQILDDYVRLLGNISRDPECAVERVPMISDSAYQILVTEQVSRETSGVALDVVESIERSFDQYQQRAAIESPDGTSLTYGELDRRSLSVARALRSNGVTPGDIAAIVLPRSGEAVAAMFGVLRAGAAFLPIDPQYPSDRIQMMLSDADPQIVLASRATARSIPRLAFRILRIDSIEESNSRTYPRPVPPDTLAYVIYTSGSTGRPKGVCIPRGALSNHCDVARRMFQLTPEDRVLQFMSHSFDAALEEIFPTFSAGATLVLRSEDSAATAPKFLDEVERCRISVLNLPTAFWHSVVIHLGSRPWPGSLRLLIIGGERAHAGTYLRFREQDSSHVRLLNAYGPTEATITSTVFDDRSRDPEELLPIGRPIEGVSHFVLDAAQGPVPRGEVGELYIGGAGLAKGYLGRPDLTSGCFVPHPFRDGAVLYATGDRVFLTESGNYAYVDRFDNQIKIRGFRVELGEVESHLLALAEVKEALVVAEAHRPHDVRLVAHVVAEPSATEKQLRSELSQRVPAHLVPAEFRFHAELPRSITGKVDRQRLAEQTSFGDGVSRPDRRATGRHEGLFEAAVRELWCDMFPSSRLDDACGFFEAGGDSLRLLELFAEIEHRTRQKPSPAEFLRLPTLENLLRLIEVGRYTDASDLLVTMNEGDPSLRPLFLIPGVCGVAVDYVHLANSLDPSIPVYCAQIDEIGDDAGSALHRYSERLVAEIAKAQNEGPYAIAGYSAGAVIALAVAKTLLDSGKNIDFMGVIDGVPPRSLKRLSPFSNPSRLFRFLTAIVGRARMHHLDSWGQLVWILQRLSPSVILSYLRWNRRIRRREGVAELLGLANGQVADHLVAKWQRVLEAVHAFRHEQLVTDLVLFRTKVDPVEGPHEPELGWSRVVTGNVVIERFDGVHREALSDRTAPVIAGLMQPYLLRRNWQPPEGSGVRTSAAS